MHQVSYCGESFLTAAEVAAPDTADVVAVLRDRTRRQSTPLEREYSDACTAMEYGWDDVYVPLACARRVWDAGSHDRRQREGRPAAVPAGRS